MIIKEVIVRQLKMKMKFDFTTSFGTIKDKEFLLIEVKDEQGNSGWGESGAFHAPWYNEETIQTNWHMLEDFLIPALLHKNIEHPDEVSVILSDFRRNYMAKAAIETAIWDLYARNKGISVATAIGGEKSKIEVGISIGIQDSVEDLLDIIDQHVNEGYKRMKVKIKPGWDIDVIRQIRQAFPDVPLMADANSAYTLNDIDLLKKLDEFDLMMIEQPLAADDIIDHAKLQKEIKTPICLDESIHSYEDTRKAIELGSCKVINIKIGRVGGLTESKRIHDLCQEHDIAVWCGGMLEAGVGRAHNIALTTLGNFILPGDTAGSSRYWEKDIIDPEVIVKDGYIEVPNEPGIGYEPNLDLIRQFTVNEKSFS
ncbi:o-succinylbenzoate synthase [Lederbergia lenta]|uniref:o-succinylbenzoate synthase n=1 Tax=Lederbergia lenta TaxID=1467 RepID=A0A2X4VXM7_LEDLE|nr:o-succinylbenzoate synthase [Lederbergia lenta]MEC2323528.1 o-succinylbenzoate synthase [Lederbergia lenta]SQI52638.1 o-succinylbenzoic acid (OSB) synthetase [Lederbergia lenta]